MKGQNCMIFCYAVIVMLLKLLYVEVTQITDSDSKMWTKMAEFIGKKVVLIFFLLRFVGFLCLKDI